MAAMEIKKQEYDPGQQWFPLGHPKRVRMSPIVEKPIPTSVPEPSQKTSYAVGEYIPLLRKSPGSSATATYLTGIKNTSPIVQLYDYGLNRPFSPIQLNTSLNNKPLDSSNTIKPIQAVASSNNSNIIKPIPVSASVNSKDKYGRPTTYNSYKKSLANHVEDPNSNWGFYYDGFEGGKKRRTRRAARKTKRRRHAKHAASRRQHKRKGGSIKCKN
jgi:hypothetical protein